MTAPSSAQAVMDALAEKADAEDAQFLQRFFKTGPEQYGAGDVFIGVRVPQTRAIAKRFPDLPLAEVDRLLDSETENPRLPALVILTRLFAAAAAAAAASAPAARDGDSDE